MNVLQVNRYSENGTHEKTLGAVYTPPRVAAALVRWAVRSPSDRVVDPSCGEGVFLAAVQTRLADLGSEHPVCIGVDIDPVAASVSGAICDDFFSWVQSAPMFDVVVGNPPFIRSHLFSEQSRSLAFNQMKGMGLHPSRLMSTWAPFLALSCTLLSDNGRLALVVPEELLHVRYAEELRNFLLARFRRVVICVPEKGIFPSVQQSVVLLLCDNELEGPTGLMTMPFADLETGHRYPPDTAPPWVWLSKWTHLFLSASERQLVNESLMQLGWHPLKEYGRVEVGIVTGFNDFFILTENRVHKVDEEFLTPVVSNARDLKGITFSGSDFDALVEKKRPTFLIHVVEPFGNLPLPLQDYLASGVQRGINVRYKCRNREPWYAVPSVWPAHALMLRQAGEVPKLVHLEKQCTSTDTIHRVRWLQPSFGKRHVVAFLNTWTLIACELMGRSYGGGVLELMPSEANRIPMPPPLSTLEDVFDSVDKSVRLRKYDSAIDQVDKIVIPSEVASAQYRGARNILAKLVARRKAKGNGRY